MVNKPKRCHFEFAQVVLCSWADSNTMKKVKIRVNIAKQYNGCVRMKFLVKFFSQSKVHLLQYKNTQ